MTVSRVINGGAGVTGKTRVAVEEAIRAVGYTPKVAVGGLSAETVIGLIYRDRGTTFTNDFLSGVFEEASARGVRLLLLKGERGKSFDKSRMREFANSGAAAFIVAPPYSDSATLLDQLGKTGLPVAAVGAYAGDKATCVRIDDRRAAFEVTQHLISLGHKQLGFIVGNPDQAASAERLAGFYAAVRAVDDVATSVAQGDFSFASGLQAAEILLGANPMPSAIFASSDEMAAAVLQVAHQRRLDVPRDLAVVGFDDTDAAAMLWPPLTTVHQPFRELASEALRSMMIEIAEGGRRRRRLDRLLGHEIVKRQSA